MAKKIITLFLLTSHQNLPSHSSWIEVLVVSVVLPPVVVKDILISNCGYHKYLKMLLMLINDFKMLTVINPLLNHTVSDAPKTELPLTVASRGLMAKW